MAAARRVLAAVVAALALASAPGADASAVLRRAVRGDGALQPQQAAQQVKQVTQQVKQVQQTQQVKEQPAERLDVNGAVDPSAPASLDPPQPDDRKAHPDAMWNGPPSWANYQDPLVAGEDDQVWEAMMSMPEGLRDALFAKEHPGAKGAKGGGGPAPCPCEGQAGCPCRTLVDADVKPEAPPTNSTCGCGGQPQCGCEPAGPPPATATCDCWEMPVCPCRVEAALASDKTFVTPELTGGGPCGCLGTADCPCSPTLNYVAPEIDTSAPTIVPTGGLEIEESESSGSGSGSGSGSSSGSDESSATTTVKSAISGGAPAESSSASS